MISKPNTDTLIADLLNSSLGMALDARAKYLLRESLYSLVRFAKAEQMMEIKNSVEKLTGIGETYGSYVLSDDESGLEYYMLNNSQQRFEFHDPE